MILVRTWEESKVFPSLIPAIRLIVCELPSCKNQESLKLMLDDNKNVTHERLTMRLISSCDVILIHSTSATWTCQITVHLWEATKVGQEFEHVINSINNKRKGKEKKKKLTVLELEKHQANILDKIICHRDSARSIF